MCNIGFYPIPVFSVNTLVLFDRYRFPFDYFHRPDFDVRHSFHNILYLALNDTFSDHYQNHVFLVIQYDYQLYFFVQIFFYYFLLLFYFAVRCKHFLCSLRLNLLNLFSNFSHLLLLYQLLIVRLLF